MCLEHERRQDDTSDRRLSIDLGWDCRVLHTRDSVVVCALCHAHKMYCSKQPVFRSVLKRAQIAYHFAWKRTASAVVAQQKSRENEIRRIKILLRSVCSELFTGIIPVNATLVEPCDVFSAE